MRFHRTCYDVILAESESRWPVLGYVDILSSDLAPGFAEIKYNRLIVPLLNEQQLKFRHQKIQIAHTFFIDNKNILAFSFLLFT